MGRNNKGKNGFCDVWEPERGQDFWKRKRKERINQPSTLNVDVHGILRRTFGYDLATPAATPRHEGYWFSVGLDAQVRLPPAGLVPEWPSIPVPPPARTAYRVNCVACAEPHCLQKSRRARFRSG